MKPKSPPTADQLIPPVKQADYRFFGPADERPAFEPNPGADPSWSNAWWLSDFSMLAYGDRDYVVNGLEGSGFTTRPEYFFEKEATQCFIAESADAIVVAFRGTELPQFNVDAFFSVTPTLMSLAATMGAITTTLFRSTAASVNDWLGNANLALTPLAPNDSSQGLVHTGFLQAFKAVADNLNDTLNTLLAQKPRPVWYTGHSLGGALATLAATSFKNPGALYTYGAPRVGDARFAQAFPGTISTTRFCVLGDPVPLVPTSSPGIPFITSIGYAHVGKAYWLEEGSAPRQLSSDVPAAMVSPLRHAPMRYSNLIWNSMVS